MFLKKMRIIRFSPILLFIVIFCLPFFSKTVFVAHDWPLLFRESRNYFPFWSLAWDYMGNGGIGGSALKTMWIDLYANFVYFISNTLNIPWWLSQRIFWILPFISLSLFSSYKFSKLFIKDELFRGISSLIFTFNTYILLIVGGGQFGIAFAYALAPLVLLGLFNLFEKTNYKNLTISCLVSGLIIALDPRVALLTFLIAFLYFLFFIKKFNLRKICFIFINLLIAGILNSYWIFPAFMSFVTSSNSSFVNSYSSVAGVKFLSFATLENTISFLHPNWPENIFGKIYFQDPIFLLFPVFAFGALIFKVKREILFLVTVGLIGIFLGKGASDPFGNIYLFLFENLPGFSLFRDSTKFYLLIAISFSVLIPYFLNSVSEKFEKFRYIFALLFVIFLLLTLKPFWSGELSGIFKPKEIPKEYIFLNQEIKNAKDIEENNFSRILWIPKRQKYGYFDPLVPSIDSEVLFKGKDIEKITEKELVNYSVGLIIVPTDPDGEIFLKDRKYSETERRKIINKVEKIDFLQRTSIDEGIKTYLTYSSPYLFTTPELLDNLERSLFISWEFKNPTLYELKLEDAKKGDLIVFSQGYDSGWVARGEGFEVKSEAYEKNLNSFRMPRDGSYSLEVYYKPQDYVNTALVISLLTLVSLSAILFVNLAKRVGK